MNYLSHYSTAGSPQDPEIVLGLALPDLLSSGRARIRRMPPRQSERYGQLRGGLAMHFAGDTVFHSHPLFLELSRGFGRKIFEFATEPQKYRGSFVGHIFLELWLDSLLVPASADGFYSLMAEADIAGAETFLALHGVASPGTLSAIMERFMEVQFLRKYAEDGGVVYGLNRIMHRAGQSAIADFDIEAVAGEGEKLMGMELLGEVAAALRSRNFD